MNNQEKVADSIAKMILESSQLITAGLTKEFTTVFEIEGNAYTLTLFENNKVRSGELTEIKN